MLNFANEHWIIFTIFSLITISMIAEYNIVRDNEKKEEENKKKRDKK
jgi:hypothetical protein